MSHEDIRWKQRFSNFEKAVNRLRDAVKLKDISELERAGIIQTYEFTFELAWKTVKDYLDEKGVTVNFPRDTIKEGFKYGIIDDGDIWIDMLEKRNLMTHAYDEQKALAAYRLIMDEYFEAIDKVYNRLKGEI